MRNWILATIITGIVIFIIASKAVSKLEKSFNDRLATINELLEN